MPTLVILATSDSSLADAWERQLAPGRMSIETPLSALKPCFCSAGRPHLAIISRLKVALGGAGGTCPLTAVMSAASPSLVFGPLAHSREALDDSERVVVDPDDREHDVVAYAGSRLGRQQRARDDLRYIEQVGDAEVLGLDAASTEFFKGGKYELGRAHV